MNFSTTQSHRLRRVRIFGVFVLVALGRVTSISASAQNDASALTAADFSAASRKVPSSTLVQKRTPTQAPTPQSPAPTFLSAEAKALTGSSTEMIVPRDSPDIAPPSAAANPVTATPVAELASNSSDVVSPEEADALLNQIMSKQSNFAGSAHEMPSATPETENASPTPAAATTPNSATKENVDEITPPISRPTPEIENTAIDDASSLIPLSGTTPAAVTKKTDEETNRGATESAPETANSVARSTATPLPSVAATSSKAAVSASPVILPAIAPATSSFPASEIAVRPTTPTPRPEPVAAISPLSPSAAPTPTALSESISSASPASIVSHPTVAPALVSKPPLISPSAASMASVSKPSSATPVPAAPSAPISFQTVPSASPVSIVSHPAVAPVAPALSGQSSPSLPPTNTAASSPATNIPVVDASLPPADAMPVDDGKPAADDAALPTGSSPSENVTINLIRKLVQRGILTQADADQMIHQAQAEAETAQVQAQATQYAIQQAASAQAAAAQAAQDNASSPAPSDAVRVTYIPENVKVEMKNQIKEELVGEKKWENWSAPGLLPAWVSNIKPFGDIRLRFEGDFYPPGNDTTGAFPNFNAINTGAPFDVAGNQFSPQYNANQDRYRFRLRARFGADVNLGNNFSTGFRIATGESDTPVSENQSFGLANQGQGGDFSMYSIWLDRAFIKYQLTGDPKADVTLEAGRFDNPFFTTSRIMWADDIGFDGAALIAKYQVTDGFTPFFVGGAFPIFNTDLNFSSNQPSKYPSNDKYLFAGQVGSDWKITKDFHLKTGVAYFYFYNVEGKLSSPFTPLTSSDQGDTDDSRPSFAQKGNTYMALRDIVPDASNDFGTINQWQYFGLATPFQDLALNARLDYTHFAPFLVSLSSEFVKNLAFNKDATGAIAVNNRGPVDTSLSTAVGPFQGGDTAWIVQLQVGDVDLAKFGDWNLGVSYRYVESDSVIDGFVDSDFGGGGTNLKGYSLSGNFSLSTNVWLGMKWYSATSIAGPPYKEDIFQFDLNAKF